MHHKSLVWFRYDPFCTKAKHSLKHPSHTRLLPFMNIPCVPTSRTALSTYMLGAYFHAWRYYPQAVDSEMERYNVEPFNNLIFTGTLCYYYHDQYCYIFTKGF